ncbi:MAG: glycosyl transferase family 1 [Planctomycetaceae bacterium]|nr:glycosyl transferase family 1 [Planctomycetaceae bacterium]
MRILAIEPYYGGSHRDFLDGWSSRSRHHWTLLTLPAHHWKWRMRHAATTLRTEAQQRGEHSEPWDLLWCSDMLSLADFKGLSHPAIARLPVIAYFHENQLTYPVRVPDERDLHFAITNFTTALAADQVWFNSAFHRDDFLAAVEALFAQMPDRPPRSELNEIRRKTRIFSPAVEDFRPRGSRRQGPPRIVWAARWEHDKDPDTLFAALRRLIDRGIDFRISVLGQSFRQIPPAFNSARRWLKGHLEHWGFLTADEYRNALLDADLFVSTAQHEFFGIAAVEAMLAGAYPLLPNRLAYPELLAGLRTAERESFLYDGTSIQLAERLEILIQRLPRGCLWTAAPDQLRRLVARYRWQPAATAMDRAAELLTATHQ